MNELSSLIPSKKTEKTKEPDFGTYHHSTSVASTKVRAVVKCMFTDVFASLLFGKDDKLRILDVGCGLGFLSCVSAEFYENARITGIDTFEHASLKRSSLEWAKENARILGFSDRIDFEKADVFKFKPAKKFDIIVSNLVFHNFGKMRFKAYSRLSSWTQAGSFVIMGDLFFSPKTDIAQLEKAFRILRQIKAKNGFEQYALLVMSRSGQAWMD
jgi:16S rRNA G1207 methylase RsmC